MRWMICRFSGVVWDHRVETVLGMEKVMSQPRVLLGEPGFWTSFSEVTGWYPAKRVLRVLASTTSFS